MAHTKIADVLPLCQQTLISVAMFSGVSNLLMLVPAFFMLNVYDKAVAFQSLPTLWVLSAITLFMFIMMASIEIVRSWMLVHLSTRLEHELAPVVYDESFHNAVRVGSDQATVQPLSDFTNLRQFITGQGVTAVFDAPWLPVYIAVMFLFHPLLGWLGVIFSIAFFVIVYVNQRHTTTALEAANDLNRRNTVNTQRQLANAEVVAAMGLLPVLRKIWRKRQDNAVTIQESSSRSTGVFNAIIKTARLGSQSAAIAAGAYLVLNQEISPGMLIAGSILIGRALQPVELAVAAWPGFIAAKGQYERLNKLISNAGIHRPRMQLPPITGNVSLKNAALAAPGGRQPILSGISFEVPAGSVCMIIGSSGAGKSTLVRGLLGLWPTVAGEIRLDGAEVANYDREALGPQVGYLPQDIELFEGSVASNIARFEEVDSVAVIQAATDAGLHDFILSLPAGYDTVLGSTEGHLSPGQKQRLALARALYRRPKFVILDEPNSNLDDIGEVALANAIKILRAEGCTVIVVSHRTPLLSLADYLLILSGGRQRDFGPTADMLAALKSPGATSARLSTDQKQAEANSPQTVTW